MLIKRLLKLRIHFFYHQERGYLFGLDIINGRNNIEKTRSSHILLLEHRETYAILSPLVQVRNLSRFCSLILRLIRRMSEHVTKEVPIYSGV